MRSTACFYEEIKPAIKNPLFYFSERKKAPTPSKEMEKAPKDEESWPLKNVIFVEDIKTVPVGKVLKVS